MKEWKKFVWLMGIFLVAYYLPLGDPKVTTAILEAFRLLQWYAVNHTLACVVPAMFIAGAISTFLSQTSVMRYLGPGSPAIAAAHGSLKSRSSRRLSLARTPAVQYTVHPMVYSKSRGC